MKLDFEQHRRFLFGLCYRLTADASEAEDLVQETFVRAITHPPADMEASMRPWLSRIAINLSHDVLRKRQVRTYAGSWLASPVLSSEVIDESLPDAHFSMAESVTFAFLAALEVLNAKERAVVILRDVYDYSVSETASVLLLSEGNVKVIHHRAREALSDYEQTFERDFKKRSAAALHALGELVQALMDGDVAKVESLLAASVVATADANGEFLSNPKPVKGIANVAKFFVALASRDRGRAQTAIQNLNGIASLVAAFDAARPREASRFVIACDVDSDGKIAALYTVLATQKLSRVQI